ncbi:MAG: solute carrier family 23 protein, partial [Nocardioidaceae bacterium]
MSMFKWDVVYGGKTPPPGKAVGPHERLSWPRTIGLGAQHVVAMFGATFVFPIVMGLSPNLAILFSGLCTILFLVIVKGYVPSYLGTSAAFVASVTAIRTQGGDSADVTGAILISGLVLALVGVLV